MTPREKLILLIKEHYDVCMNCNVGYCSDDDFDDCLADYLLANGVVLPCRCGECAYWDSGHISCEGFAKCLTGESGIRYRHKNGFCSCGDRKGGETDD